MTNPPVRSYPLKRISARRFKCFETLECELSGITVLFGANSAGKSTVLKAIASLAQHASVETDRDNSTFDWNGPLQALGDFADVSFGGRLDGSVELGIAVEIPKTLSAFNLYSRGKEVEKVIGVDDISQMSVAVNLEMVQGAERYTHNANSSSRLRRIRAAVGIVRTIDGTRRAVDVEKLVFEPHYFEGHIAGFSRTTRRSAGIGTLRGLYAFDSQTRTSLEVELSSARIYGLMPAEVSSISIITREIAIDEFLKVCFDLEESPLRDPDFAVLPGGHDESLPAIDRENLGSVSESLSTLVRLEAELWLDALRSDQDGMNPAYMSHPDNFWSDYRKAAVRKLQDELGVSCQASEVSRGLLRYSLVSRVFGGSSSDPSVEALVRGTSTEDLMFDGPWMPPHTQDGAHTVAAALVRDLLTKQLKFVGPLRAKPTAIQGFGGSSELLPDASNLASYLFRNRALSVRELVPMSSDDYSNLIASSFRYISTSGVSQAGFPLAALADAPPNIYNSHPPGKLPRLLDEVNRWLVYFRMGVQVEIETQGTVGVAIRLRDESNGRISDMTQMGVGLSQILPILVQCLTAEAGGIVVIEQPELHLHPDLQDALADFFLRICLENGVQLIIETHSDVILRKLATRSSQDNKHIGEVVRFACVEKNLGVSHVTTSSGHKYLDSFNSATFMTRSLEAHRLFNLFSQIEEVSSADVNPLFE